MSNRMIQRAIMIITVLVVAVVAWTLLNPTKHDDKVVIPQQLSNLPQTDMVSGPAAINQISQMHQTDITISDAYIAKYAAGDQEITLWVSSSPTDQEGQALFDVMDKKMPTSQVFTNREELKLKDTQVIKVQGMGLEHYYWVKGKINFWVAVKGLEPMPVLEEVMTKI